MELVSCANTQQEPFAQRRRDILRHLPSIMTFFAEQVFGFIGSQLGISIPTLGIQGFPFGTCTVVTPPTAEGPEMEVDVLTNSGSRHVCLFVHDRVTKTCNEFGDFIKCNCHDYFPILSRNKTISSVECPVIADVDP